jgi:hypothetical protein
MGRAPWAGTEAEATVAMEVTGFAERPFSALLSSVYEHPVEVLRHPGTGVRLVMPRRAGGPRESSP